jgi:glycosyltransferase involved in cell wall biosynthesis
VQTHPTDLTCTRGAVGQAIDEAGWDFHVVGTGAGVREALGLSRPVSSTGWVPFKNYPWAMAEIGLGVVPLDDNPFNQAKSCLKMMEFASLGVPVIATATPDNVRLHKMGVGQVVNHPSQWYRRLRKLVDSEGYRGELADRSRMVMRQNTYEKKCGMWAKAWGLEK